jgi:anti-sigma factor RsiW
MSDKSMSVSEEELQAYVDGLLDSARAAEIEARLAANPEAAERAQAYRAQNRALRAMFEPVLDEPVPARLTETLRRPRRTLPLRAAAALAWLAVGAVAGYGLHGWLTPQATPTLIADGTEARAARQGGRDGGLAERAAVAHVVYAAEVLHPVEVTAEQEKHLVQWLSKRLGKELRTPDFTPFGYQLVGGRLLPGDRGPAAQFMYQDARGARLTLYVSVPDEGTQPSAFRYEKEAGTHVLYWVDRDLCFALAGEPDRARLMDIAHVAYQAFNF